jgi:hypothetical protein
LDHFEPSEAVFEALLDWSHQEEKDWSQIIKNHCREDLDSDHIEPFATVVVVASSDTEIIAKDVLNDIIEATFRGCFEESCDVELESGLLEKGTSTNTIMNPMLISME